MSSILNETKLLRNALLKIGKVHPHLASMAWIRIKHQRVAFNTGDRNFFHDYIADSLDASCQHLTWYLKDPG